MRTLLLPLCCLLAVVSFAQTSATDSLEQIFSEEKDAAKRLELLSQMTNLAFGADFKVALGYAKRGMALSEQTGDKNWQPKFYEMTGRMHANLLHLDSANLFFDKATAAYRAVGNRRGEATTAFKIAWVHKRKGEMKEAMAADLQALRIMEKLGDQEGIANALGRVAEDLELQGRQQEALEYARRSIDICQKNGFQQEMPEMHTSLWATTPVRWSITIKPSR